jgi:hypothetical protein
MQLNHLSVLLSTVKQLKVQMGKWVALGTSFLVFGGDRRWLPDSFYLIFVIFKFNLQVSDAG